ncbi:Photosystem II Pbs27 [Dillenia turbinata]|uniref:Photosystem II Pbs27 n=1 Tax=Dillenia turbinata TaxID=194707 RepID=A0AAN8Z129_9MAGN
MASPTLLTPNTQPKPLTLIKSKLTSTIAAATPPPPSTQLRRREFSSSIISLTLSTSLTALATPAALATSDDEYIKDTSEVINKVRTTINMQKSDPNIADAVAELRETSNTWVAKYRREKALLGRPSFRDIYSALNAVSGHYISFGPTAPIPAKRKARILEEIDNAEKAISRGR